MYITAVSYTHLDVYKRQGFDVCEKQLFSLIHKVHNVEVNTEQIDQYIPSIMDEFADLSKEDVIKKFASLEFNRFLDYYSNAPDLNASADDRGDRGCLLYTSRCV